MAEKKLSVKETIKSVVFTVLAVAFFFILWGTAFILSLVFTLNVVLSLFTSFLISATATMALITVLTPRQRLALNKKQKIGAYVVYAIICAFHLPLIQINLPLFLGILPTLLFVLFVIIHGASRRGKVQK